MTRRHGFTLLGLLLAAATLGAQAPKVHELTVAPERIHWGYYDARFAFLSERRDQSVALVSVTDVECEADGGNARCNFVAQGRFEDGTILRRSMESRFQRQADGSIEMLIPVASR